jgi:hypothetical protein
MVVSHCSIPATWPTIGPFNDKIYLEERQGTSIFRRVLSVAHGTYVATDLASVLSFTLGVNYTVQFDGERLIIDAMAPVTQFLLIGDSAIQDVGFPNTWVSGGATFDPLPPLVGPPGPRAKTSYHSANTVFGFTISGLALVTTYIGTAVDVRGVHNIFIGSSRLNNFKQIAPNGSRDVIRHLGVNVAKGQVLEAITAGAIEDAVPVGGLTVRSFDLSLKDSFGFPVDLQGSDWSCALVFFDR